MKTDPKKAEELFDRVLQFAPEERSAFLAGACGNDADLRRRIEDLLMASETRSGFLAANDTGESPETLFDEAAPVEQAGSQIGRYKLLEKLGEGGFGFVWAAEQREPVKRRVALKIIKLGMDTKQVVARFEAERQALALMDHPNIAKVLDAGSTDTGRPYFVMELVKGVPITHYCDQEKLGTEARLELFIKVCLAIQHAHQKGIIHRDIKPSNIMVTLHDGVPVPKVIDFGIAKATQQELTEKTIYTQYSQFIGTPAYMSPEQAEMSGLDIDTRSDIYSLGVLLYELLTGSTPFDTKELMQSGLDEMRKIIREREPIRPSTRLSQTHESVPAMKVKPQAKIEKDLDWIVMTCLEKDRARRYETANGLAKDIVRFLKSEPVQACPPSAAYQFQKAWRRHRLVFNAGIAVAAALTVALIISVWFTHKVSVANELLEFEKSKALKAEGEIEIERDHAIDARLEAEKNALAANRNVYGADMNLAALALSMNDSGKAFRLLTTYRINADLQSQRGWEWRYLWNQVNAKNELATSAHHERAVTGVSFLGDSSRVVSGSCDGTIKIWDIPTGQVETLVEMDKCEIRTIAASTDGAYLATAWKDYRTDPEERMGVHILDAVSGEILHVIEDGGPVGNQHRMLEFLPGQSSLFVGEQKEDTPVDRWAFYDWARESRVELLEGRIGPMACSLDGKTVAFGHFEYGGNDWKIQVLNTADPEQRTEIQIGDRYDCLAVSPDGNFIATGHWTPPVIKVFDRISGELYQLKGHTAWICALVFSPDGERLYSASADQTIRIWDLKTRETLAVYRGHSDEVWALALSPDGTTLVSGSKDNCLKLWPAFPLTTKDPIVRFLDQIDRRSRASVKSPDGSSAIVAGVDKEDRSLVRFHEIGSERRLSQRTFRLPDRKIYDITLTWDLRLNLLVGLNNRYPEELITVSLDEQSGIDTTTIENPDGYTYLASDSTLVFHGRKLLRPNRMSNAEFTTIDWPPLPEANTVFVGLLPNSEGRYVVFASDQGTLFLFDADAKQLTSRQHAHDGNITGVEFTPDGTRIFSSGLDGFAKCWDAKTLKPIGAAMRSQLLAIHSLTLSPDGKRLVTGSTHGALTIWDAKVLRELATIHFENNTWTSKNLEFVTNDVLIVRGRDSNFKDLGWHVLLAPLMEEIDSEYLDAVR